MISANSPTSPIISTSLKSVSYPCLRSPLQKPNNKNSSHAKTQSLQECVRSRKVRTVSLASCFTPRTCSCEYKCVHDKRSQSVFGSSAKIFHENLHGEVSALSTDRKGRKEEEEWRGKTCCQSPRVQRLEPRVHVQVSHSLQIPSPRWRPAWQVAPWRGRQRRERWGDLVVVVVVQCLVTHLLSL